jgi:erythromycin esterase-like protein
MWANSDVLELIQWMKSFNHKKKGQGQIGFHGLDVYSLFESMEEALVQLERISPALAAKIRLNYECLEQFQGDEKAYIRSLAKTIEGCEAEVVHSLQQLLEIRMQDKEDRETLFNATQNARIVKSAEKYYRAMIHADDNSWNIRDHHMMETLDLLLDHYGEQSKAIVWEHNTHIGDYRATDMVKFGHVNLGGLAREKYGETQVKLVGFGTYEGTVIASHAWAGPIETLEVPPAKSGSYEQVMHSCVPLIGSEDYYMLLDLKSRETALAKKMGHRAIGVVYDPQHEHWGNYVPTSLAERYDAFIFLDQTEALIPLATQVRKDEIPETYPGGL